MTLDQIAHRVRASGLAIVGAFHPVPEDDVPEGIATLLLLGADGPVMWQAYSTGPEHSDGAPHPMDRWSRRVIGTLATDLSATAFFPFGGPPWQPFQKWAFRGEGAETSPVSMQVTLARGLWTSYRGALGFADRIDLPVRSDASPCADCDAPCLRACPVDAFATGSYDVPSCVAHLKTGTDLPCRSGCLIRKACPYGQAINLPAQQRAFHIDAFLRANG